MDFSLRRVTNENMYYYESGKDSDIQLVFTPGSLNPDIWRHQLKYFSRNFRTISFEPTSSFKGHPGEKNALKNVLEQDDIDNAVLISHHIGNSLVQEFESHESVAATVITGAPNGNSKFFSRTVYRLLCSFGRSKPKLVKKLLFSDSTSYRVVKDFVSEIKPADYSDFKSFISNYSLRRPFKNAMVIHAEEDRFSEIDFAKDLKGEGALSVINNAGTFCFYEKPQEFNKALSDFLKSVEENVEKTEVEIAKEKNRSLWDYGSKKGEESKKSSAKKKEDKKVNQQRLKVKR
ncbi:MAG: alpha/beta fold hydrolase [Candidatus Nanohaloarchaea archaeon]